MNVMACTATTHTHTQTRIENERVSEIVNMKR